MTTAPADISFAQRVIRPSQRDVLALLQQALPADELDTLLAQGATLSDEEAGRLTLVDWVSFWWITRC